MRFQSQNSLGQDPCNITGDLYAACNGNGTITPLTSTQGYYAPDLGTPTPACNCNSVIYSLFAACGLCQGGQAATWTRWITDCNFTYLSQYPYNVPPGTAIPRWAFINVTTLPNETFNVALAESVGQSPEATPVPLSTATTTFSSKPTNTSSGGSNNGGTGNQSTAGIVGGIVGGVVLLIAVVIGVIVGWRRQARVPPKSPQAEETSEHNEIQPPSPTFLPDSANLSYDPYNSPDGRTNSPPPMYEILDTVVNKSSPNEDHRQSLGQYTGLPEPIEV
ncbi:hypothetical protein BJ322DRAFT_562703 [Thelephora terrestris]|uniref:Uncharacterized protein n=1 Tax=Thelephora terrestris TaxID=56493 RepID=A0A9P6HPJ0_9AGAM|nr:hypothetical protein BJ322DRAFT_562703 [Thelephora terrestris]